MPNRKTLVRLKQVFFACLVMAQFAFVQMPTRVVYAETSAQSSLQNMIISAVQITGGTGHTQEDFVEFYNPTNQPIDLSGYRLVKRTATGLVDTAIKSWTESTVVAPYHFYLWANSGYSVITPSADATTSGTLGDNNGIALRFGVNDIGVIVDALSWGTTSNIFQNASLVNPTANQSLLRSDLFSSNNVFEIGQSKPRNSLSELLPAAPQVAQPPAPTSEPVSTPSTVPEPSPASIPQPEQLPPLVLPQIPSEEIPPVEVPAVEIPTPEPESVPPVILPEPIPVPELPAVVEPIDIKITELLPNPTGNDSGFEQVELYNSGTTKVNLKDFKLDDVLNSDSLSSNAYSLGEINIESKTYLSVLVPAGEFALNNTGGDVVTLFDSSNKPLDTVLYESDSPENESWSFFEDGWVWAEPSFGNVNVLKEKEVEETAEEEEETLKHSHNNNDLIISEVYSQPNSNEQEFIEIYNSGEETALLSEVELYIGDRHRQLPEVELKAGEYFVITQADFPIQLRNSGQEVKLQEGTSLIKSVVYSAGLKGSSYSLFEDGFLWTTKVTKGQKNVLELPKEVVKMPAVTKVAPKSSPKASTTAKKSTATKAVSKVTTSPKASAPANTAVKKSTDKPAESNTLSNKQKAKANGSVGKIIAMGAASVAAAIAALYKFVFSGGIE